MVASLLPDDPRHLGSYWLAGRLGAGGQGVVYEGYDGEGVRVAVKALHAQYATGPYREQLRRELQALVRVASFCTAQLIATDLGHTPPYLVSEHVPGPSLQSHVEENGPYRPADLVLLAIGIATALTSIHQAGVTHRDLKPANVLLGPDGPRVIDFGIARTGEMARHEAGPIEGTLRWMAPEVISGHGFSPAVDVWAWGAIVLFAATGRLPFDADTVPALRRQIVNVHTDVTVLAEPLRSLVARAMSKDPASRPTSRELLEGLIGGDHHVASLEEGQRKARGPHSPAVEPSPAQQAEQAFAALDPQARASVPGLLLRMVTGAPTAQQALRTAYYGDFLDGTTSEDGVRRILDTFCAAGIVVRDGVGFTLAVPALVRAWPRLREWVETDSTVLDAQHRLADAARSWDVRGRKRSDLPQGNALDTALGWAMAGRRHLTVNLRERAFLDGSVAAAHRRRRIRTLLSAVLAVLLLIATGAAGTATVQTRNLAAENKIVSGQRDRAEGTRIAGLASSLRTIDPVTAKQLAIASARLAPGDIDGRSALVALDNQVEASTYLPPGTSRAWTVVAGGTGDRWAYVHENHVKIVDIDARRVIRTFTVTGVPVYAGDRSGGAAMVALSDDGRYLAAVHTDLTVTTWDTATGTPLPVTFRAPAVPGFFTMTGARILTSDAKQTIVWDARTGTRLLTVPHGMTAALITPRGTLAGVSGASVEYWSIALGKQLSVPKFRLGTDDLSDVGVSPDGKTVAVVQGDQLAVLNLGTGDQRTYPITGSRGEIAFSADGRYLAVDRRYSISATVSVFDLSDSAKAPIFEYDAPDGCGGVSFGPGGRNLRCVGGQGTVVELSLASALDSVVPSDLTAPYAVLSQDGSTLAVESSRGMQIMNPVTRVTRSDLPIDPTVDGTFLHYALSRDGRLLANVHSSGGIDVWDTRTATRKTTISTGHALDGASSYAFSPDGRTLAVLSMSGRATLLEFWDVATGALRAKSLGAPPAGVTASDLLPQLRAGLKPLFSADGRTVRSINDQGLVDASTGARVAAPTDDVFFPLALSAGGLVADANAGATVLWDNRTLELGFAINLGNSDSYAMAFSADGRLLAVGDTLDEVYLLDVADRRPFGIPLTGRYVPIGQKATITDLAFTSDGSRLVTVDIQGRLRTDLIDPVKITAALCAEVGPLSPATWKTYLPDIPYRVTC